MTSTPGEWHSTKWPWAQASSSSCTPSEPAAWSGARYSRTTRTPNRRPSPPSPPAWRTPRWPGPDWPGSQSWQRRPSGLWQGASSDLEAPGHEGTGLFQPDAGWVDSFPTRTGPLESGQPGRTVANRRHGPGIPRPLPDMVGWWGQPAHRPRDDCAQFRGHGPSARGHFAQTQLRG